MNSSKKPRTIKVNPKTVNVSKFFNSKRLITLKQLQSIQKNIVDNLIRTGSSVEDIKHFLKESNKLKRSINAKSKTKTAQKNFRNLLNYGDVVLKDGKYYFRIKKPRLSAVAKSIGPKEFDENLLKALKRNNVLSKSSEKIIKARKTAKSTFGNFRNHPRFKEIIEILETMSNPKKYWVDVSRLLFDYLGISLSQNETLAFLDELGF